MFLEKCATSIEKKLLVAHFLRKSATHIGKKSELHIFREKCNTYRKLVGSYTFLKKSATRI
jgi:hypothetical protein